MRFRTLAALILAFVASSASAADWQAWLGAGAGRGGYYGERDGATITFDLGARYARNSVVLSEMLSIPSSTSYDPTSEATLWFGHLFGNGVVQVELQAGPSIFDDRRRSDVGMSYGAHFVFAFSSFSAVSVRAMRSFHETGDYTSLLMLLEFGKLR